MSVSEVRTTELTEEMEELYRSNLEKSLLIAEKLCAGDVKIPKKKNSGVPFDPHVHLKRSIEFLESDDYDTYLSERHGVKE